VDRVHLLPPSSGKLILLIYIYLYPRTVGRTMTKCLAKTGETLVSMNRDTVSQAYFALHETLTKFKFFRKNFFFGTVDTSEAFLSISQNLKVTRLRCGTQMNLWTCWRNFDLSRSFERFLGLVHGFVVLQ
jgi:hypothetical protein